MALTEDLDIKIGDTFWSQRWAVVISGNPIDLTQGWTVRAQIRSRPDATTVLHTFTGTGVQVTAPVPNADPALAVPSTVQLYIPPATTQVFAEWTGVWDLEIEHPTFGVGGTLYRKTVMSGIARTAWDVTRP